MARIRTMTETMMFLEDKAESLEGDVSKLVTVNTNLRQQRPDLQTTISNALLTNLGQLERTDKYGLTARTCCQLVIQSRSRRFFRPI